MPGGGILTPDERIGSGDISYRVREHRKKTLRGAMTDMGHELPSGRVNGMSAKPPITAVIADVGFVGDVPILLQK